MAGGIAACPLRGQVDPRLVRFSAGATAGVLVIALLLLDVARPLALGLIGTQVAVFGFTGFVSFQWSLWARFFAAVIWPRVAPPAALEDARPHRFAQVLGFALTAPALVCFALGADVTGYVLAGVAVATTTLNAITGVCLGCKLFRVPR